MVSAVVGDIVAPGGGGDMHGRFFIWFSNLAFLAANQGWAGGAIESAIVWRVYGYWK